MSPTNPPAEERRWKPDDAFVELLQAPHDGADGDFRSLHPRFGDSVSDLQSRDPGKTIRPVLNDVDFRDHTRETSYRRAKRKHPSFLVALSISETDRFSRFVGVSGDVDASVGGIAQGCHRL